MGIIMDIVSIREKIKNGEYELTLHTIKRCDSRNILLEEIEQVLAKGKVIEEYPDDKPFPSCLIMDFVRSCLPLYVVCAFSGEKAYIITAHWLDPTKWLDPWTRREKI
jgi:hypothetical protein